MNIKLENLVAMALLSMHLLFFSGGCAEKEPLFEGDQKDFTPSFLNENKMMRYFVDSHPGQVVLKYAQADLDSDGQTDLIVIYQVQKAKNEMRVIRYTESEFVETNPLPAPISDQMIRFRDIDGKAPLEFILQGRKGAKVGYAIFRIEKGKLIDVFGDGMQDCC